MSAQVDYSARIEAIRRNRWIPLTPPPPLKDTDLPRIGHQIGVGEDPIHAILDVEAPRGGYDAKGRLLPLYEPHVAYRNASGALRDKLVELGLAYKTWGQQPYPKDSYPRFEQAYALAPVVAIKACSWSRSQILGENFVAAGYDSPQEMYVRLAEGGEAEHLQAMVNFIRATNLDDDLRTLNWAGFARGYNGPQYAKNGYHTKLAARYKFWVGKPDTPWSVDMLDAAPEVPFPPVPVPAEPPAAAPEPAPAPGPGPTSPQIPWTPPTEPSQEPAPPSIPGTGAEPITPPVVIVPPAKKGWYKRFAAWIDSVFYFY